MILDFAAVRDDGGGGGYNQNSKRFNTFTQLLSNHHSILQTLSFYSWMFLAIGSIRWLCNVAW